MKTPAQHMRNAGPWGVSLFALAMALLALLAVYSKAPERVGLPLPATVAFSPGSGFDVAKWCKSIAATVQGAAAPDASSPRFVAARGAESVEWTVNLTGDADHYWRDANGIQRRAGVIVTEAARACMTTSRP